MLKINRLSISTAYWIALVILVIWATFAYITMHTLIDSQRVYGKLINISGMQRTLSQRTALLCDLVVDENPQIKEKLLRVTQRMQSDYKYITSHLTSKQTHDFYYGKDGLDGSMQNYFSMLNYFYNNPDGEKSDAIIRVSLPLLVKQNQAVGMFQRENDTIVEELKTRELFIYMGTLITLLLEAFIIILPMIRSQKNYTKKLEEEVKAHMQELVIFKAIFDHTKDGMLITDSEGVILDVNKSFTTITGYTKEEVIGATPRILKSGRYDTSFYEQIWHDIQNNGVWRGRITNKDNNGKEYSEFQTILRLENEISGAINYVSIFSDHRETSKLLNKLRNLIDKQGNIVILADGVSLQFVNQVFLDFFGYASMEEFSKVHQCISEYFLDHEDYFNLKKVREGEDWIQSARNLRDSERMVLMRDQYGTARAFSFTVNRFENDIYIISFTDINETSEINTKLRNQVEHDKLTECYNREYLYSHFDIFMDEALRKQESVILIFFDIDYFKNINDTYGHNRGDEVLITIADIIRNNIRKNDIFVRWGGEEFIVLLQMQNYEEGIAIAEKFRKAVESHRFDEVLQVTCSFGVAQSSESIALDIFIEQADVALYRAKKRGRNRTEFYDSLNKADN